MSVGCDVGTACDQLRENTGPPIGSLRGRGPDGSLSWLQPSAVRAAYTPATQFQFQGTRIKERPTRPWPCLTFPQLASGGGAFGPV